MLNGNVNSLVGDIEALLKDICEFLGNNIDDGFSKEQKSVAERLINRSKSQLQTISKITADIPESDASYVDMTPKDTKPFLPPKPVPNDNYPTEDYSTVEEMIKDCPYKSMSASEAKSDDNKWGYLERKKTVWFLGHQIKQLGVIVDGWLLLYSSEKDIKPIEFVDLEMFTVKYVDAKDVKCKKEARSFELMSSSKNYQFLAKNAKDMDQWITAISKTTMTSSNQNAIEQNIEIKKPKQTKTALKELPPLPQLPSIPNPYLLNNDRKRESMDNYDVVDVTKEKYCENGENIYECPIQVTSPNLPKPIEKQEQSPPPLPPYLNNKPKYFLHSHKQTSPSQLPIQPQSIEVEENEEVEYDLPLNEKMQAEQNISMNQQKVESVKIDAVDDSQEIYDEVITPFSKPELKPNIRQFMSKMDTKVVVQKNQPKQKYAGISRSPSYPLRDN